MIQNLPEFYTSNPGCRALTQLVGAFIPIVSAADAALMAHIANAKAEDDRAFFDELFRDPTLISDDLIRDNDFVHAFTATYRATINSSQREKAIFFARLLKGRIRHQEAGRDAYEEYLHILEGLSVREIIILHLLKESEVEYQQAAERAHITDLGEIKPDPVNYFEDFQGKVDTRFGLDKDRLQGVLTRISRTGLIDQWRGLVRDAGPEARWKTTPVYDDLASWVQLWER